MPFALHLGQKHYVALVQIEPDAPRREPGHIQEFRGRLKYGEGQQIRLYGRHAVQLGSWTSRPPDEQEIIDEFDRAITDEDDDTVMRLLTNEEIDDLSERMNETVEAKLRRGWVPPPWHWMYYNQRYVEFLSRHHLAKAVAYNKIHMYGPKQWLVMFPWPDRIEPVRQRLIKATRRAA
jgi:hypothetical protein